MIRSIAAVLLGYIGMVALVVPFFTVLQKMGKFGESLDNSTLPELPWLLLILVWGFIAAMAGGWITVAIANHAHQKHIYALLVFLLLMWVLSSFGEYAQAEPLWMRIGNLVVGLTGISLGSYWAIRSLTSTS